MVNLDNLLGGETIPWSLRYPLDRCAIKSPWHLLHVEEQWCVYVLHAGKEGGGALMPPNNTPVYSVLGLPLLNTFLTFQWLHSIQKSAKGDSRRFFFPFLSSPELRGRYTMIPWELPGIWWWCRCRSRREEEEEVGRGGRQCLYCLISIGSQWRVGAAVLVNNCLLWRNSTQRGISRSDFFFPFLQRVQSSLEHGKATKLPWEDVTL